MEKRIGGKQMEEKKTLFDKIGMVITSLLGLTFIIVAGAWMSEFGYSEYKLEQVFNICLMGLMMLKGLELSLKYFE